MRTLGSDTRRMTDTRAWVSMRIPAMGQTFELPDGRLVQEVGERIECWPVDCALVGCVIALTEETNWTAARRDQWLALIAAVLDYAMPVIDSAPSASQTTTPEGGPV